MHAMFKARRQARQHESQRNVAVFPPTYCWGDQVDLFPRGQS